jgi:FkbM family methyltransferase
MKNNNLLAVFAAKTFMRMHTFFHNAFNLNLKGVSFFYKFLNNEDYIRFGGKELFYNPKVRGSYARLINGKYNETETHIFIRNVLNLFPSDKFTIVEVGGNVGEFLVDFGGDKQVEKFYIFEPQDECVYALNKTIDKNNFGNVILTPKAVYDAPGFVSFDKSESFSSSHIDTSGNNEFMVETISLDSVNINPDNLIMLLDAEGAELKIVRGAKKLINENLPLIIFEYNHITKLHFEIEEMQDELGSDYEIYRLNQEGAIDKNMSGKMWNLVAVNINSIFKKIPQ